MVKRFQIETSTLDQKFIFITEHRSSKLYFATMHPEPILKYGSRVKNGKEEETTNLAEFIDVKGWKAIGNRLIDRKIISMEDLSKEIEEPNEKDDNSADSDMPSEGLFAKPKDPSSQNGQSKKDKDDDDSISMGDTIDFDV